MGPLSPQDKTLLGLLAMILVVGVFLFATGDHARPKPPPTINGSALQRIDIAAETMSGAATFRPTEPTIKRSFNRGAAFADVFVPNDVTRPALIAATKNALIRLYQGQDPSQVQWIEIHVYLDGEVPGEYNQAAIGVLNVDRKGYLNVIYRRPWHIEVRLLDAEKRRAAGLGPAAMQRLLEEMQKVARWRRDFAVARGAEPTRDDLLDNAAEIRFLKKELEKILETHEKLYSDREVLEWNLR